MAGETAPGWYPDPRGADQLRYWDGTAWTDHVSSAGRQAATAEVPRDAEKEPLATWALVLSLVGLLVCPVVGSAAALFVSMRASRALKAGQRDGRGLVTASRVISVVALLFWVPIIT